MNPLNKGHQTKLINLINKELEEGEPVLKHQSSHESIPNYSSLDEIETFNNGLNDIQVSNHKEKKEYSLSKVFSDFIRFLLASHVFSLGVGIIIGTAFTDVINSFIVDIITPPIGLLLADSTFENMFFVLKQGSTNVIYQTVKQASDDGAVTLNFGFFLLSLLRFLLISFILFWLIKFYKLITAQYKKDIKKLMHKKSTPESNLSLYNSPKVGSPTPSVIDFNTNNFDTSLYKQTKLCPFCFTNIDLRSTRCANCTSLLNQDCYQDVNTSI